MSDFERRGIKAFAWTSKADMKIVGLFIRTIRRPFITSLKCLFTGIGLEDEVVADSDEPVAVVPLLVEAVRGGDEHVGGEDGGGAHEVRLARLSPEEEAGQPGERALRGRGGSSAVFIRPDDPT